MSSDRLPQRRGAPPPPPPPSGLRDRAQEAVQRGRGMVEEIAEQGEGIIERGREVVERGREAAEQAASGERSEGGATERALVRQRARQAVQQGRDAATDRSIKGGEVGSAAIGTAQRRRARADREEQADVTRRARESQWISRRLHEREQLRHGIVVREILGPPVSLRSPEEGGPPGLH
ncbi:MAG: hypothetical protein ACOCT8_00720 [Actinomycetota bacterium]